MIDHQCQVIETECTEMTTVKEEVNVETEMKLADLSIVGIKQPIEDASVLIPHLNSASCILYIADGQNINIKRIASFINSLFNCKEFLVNPVPILLCVNKSDQRGCVHNSAVFYAVQKEVGELQNAPSDYEFRKYAPCTVDCCNCSVLGNSIQTIHDYLKASIY